MAGILIEEAFEYDCSQQIIPVILMVERGLGEETIVDWLEEALSDVFAASEFRRVATVYSRKFEEIYAHIYVRSQTVCQETLLRRLSSPPDAIKGLHLGWG